MTKLKAIICDLDNTLYDFLGVKRLCIEATVKAMLEAGLEASKVDLMNKIYVYYWDKGIEDQNVLDTVVKKELGKINYRILAAGVVSYRKVRAMGTELYPNVIPTLVRLIGKGLKLAVISDAPRLPFWIRMYELGLYAYFDCIVTAEDVGGRKKPDPALFLRALKDLNVKPEEPLMVGDWAERDIAGARRVGMRTAFAKYGDQFHTRVVESDYILENGFYEVLQIVDLDSEIKEEGNGTNGRGNKKVTE